MHYTFFDLRLSFDPWPLFAVLKKSGLIFTFCAIYFYLLLKFWFHAYFFISMTTTHLTGKWSHTESLGGDLIKLKDPLARGTTSQLISFRRLCHWAHSLFMCLPPFTAVTLCVFHLHLSSWWARSVLQGHSLMIRTAAVLSLRSVCVVEVCVSSVRVNISEPI